MLWKWKLKSNTVHWFPNLFGGSGSTLIGCEQTGRKAYLMELDELYCDVIVTRWEQFTGQRAVRESLSDTVIT
jgi:DNA modification methylase